jgi:hypothetical protein
MWMEWSIDERESRQAERKAGTAKRIVTMVRARSPPDFAREFQMAVSHRGKEHYSRESRRIHEVGASKLRIVVSAVAHNVSFPWRTA